MVIKLVLAALLLLAQGASVEAPSMTGATWPGSTAQSRDVPPAGTQDVIRPPEDGHAHFTFRISGNQILDWLGRPFIVKGADVVYGRFAGGNANGWGLTNYQNAQRDLDQMRAAGYNLARISVSYDLATLPPTSPDYVPYTEYMTELDNVVTWVTQRGMVAEVSNGQTALSSNVNAFVNILALRYRRNPLVWLKPDNEPNCEDGDPLKCLDWATWQLEQSTYVKTIRATGYAGPIVINCVGWSIDCSQVFNFPIGDKALIYGAHRYGAGATSWDASQQADADSKWAALATRAPFIVDEVGTQSSSSSPLTWSQGFLGYVVDWVLHRGGNGCIAFVDSWSDSNAMIDASTGRWNAWGQTFIDSYLKKLPAQNDDD
jgi:cellulase (glycosyl hydrolase family 5)